ncbi:gamma-glutamyl-gamma-aminobutyrate hydrolase family protein [Actinomycetes bacterium KLBMP 9759]
MIPRLALVGDRSPAVRAHARIPALLDALAERDELILDAYWIPTDDAVEPGAVDGFDAVWAVPGSPYRNEAGALAAIRTARERRIPFLGTCGGFQHAVLEFARTVCGLDVDHAENTPGTTRAVIVPLVCSLAGHERSVRLAPDSRIAQVLGAERTVERYLCSYGPDPAAVDTLRRHGMAFTGHDDDGEVRVLELPGHPFFLATLFQPELAGDGTHPHPLIAAFARAAAQRAVTRT